MTASTLRPDGNKLTIYESSDGLRAVGFNSADEFGLTGKQTEIAE